MPAPIASIKRTCFHRDVYEPSDDSFLLVDALHERLLGKFSDGFLPKICVEVGCGTGYVISSLSLMLREAQEPSSLLAIDLNPSAAQATVATLKAHRVTNVDVAVADLVGPLARRLTGTVDLLIFNPPYVATPDEEVDCGGIAAAWAGGNKGRRVTDRLLPLVADILSPMGEFFLVAVPDNDIPDLMDFMGKLGLKGCIFMERSADEEHLFVLRYRRAA